MLSNEELEGISQEDLERELSRLTIEWNLVELLQELFEEEEKATNWNRDTFLSNLSNITHSWQALDSGTVGEVISRWVGHGFLVDFPNIARSKPDDKGRDLRISRSAAGKWEIDATVYYRDIGGSEEQYAANYQFRVSKDELNKREREIKEERDKAGAKLRHLEGGLG